MRTQYRKTQYFNLIKFKRQSYLIKSSLLINDWFLNYILLSGNIAFYQFEIHKQRDKRLRNKPLLLPTNAVYCCSITFYCDGRIV